MKNYPYNVSENLILITNTKNELIEWSNNNKIITNINKSESMIRIFEKSILTEELFDQNIKINTTDYYYQILDISISSSHILFLISEMSHENKLDTKQFKGNNEKENWKFYLEYFYENANRIFICTLLSEESDSKLLAKIYIDKFNYSIWYSPDFPIKKNFFHKVCCGNNFSLAIDSNGRLFSWGYGETGCLGNGRNKYVEIPIEISVLEESEKVEFKDIKVGCNFVLAWDKNGNLWSWGQNDFNQLGYEKVKYNYYPKKINFPYPVKIFSCGLYHAICMIEGSIVYSWGQNNNGQLGLGHLRKSTQPEIISYLKGDNIENFSCGINNTCCVNRNGLYYAWGNNSFGKLGIEDIKIEDFGRNFTIPHEFSLGLENHFDIGEFMEEVKLLNNFSLGKTNYGNYYAWGNIDWLMNEENINLNENFLVDGFKIIQILKYKNEHLEILKESSQITDVITGLNNTIGLTDIGEMFIWGSNLKHQHGCNKDKISKIYKDLLNKYKIEKKNEFCPIECLPHLNDFFSVINRRSITNISIGFNHILAVESQYTVYSWGCNKYGQLGLGYPSDFIAFPKRINSISGLNFKKCVAVADQSYALTENGILYSWGNSSEGKLGLGNRIEKGNILIPEKVEIEKKLKIFDIFIGERHSFILCKLNKDELSLIEKIISNDKNLDLIQDKIVVFSFGCNEYGQLGIKNKFNQLEPVLIDINKKIKQISCGYDNSGFITEDHKLFLFGNIDSFFEELKSSNILFNNKSEHYIKDKSILFPIEFDLNSISNFEDKIKGIYLSKNYNIIHLENNTGYYWGDFIKPSSNLKRITKHNQLFYFDKISINRYHACCISSDNNKNLYSWGIDKNTGRLGNLIKVNTSKFKVKKKKRKKTDSNNFLEPKKIKILKVFLKDIIINNNNNKLKKQRSLIKEDTQSYEPNRSISELNNSTLKKSDFNINVSFENKIDLNNINNEFLLNDEYLNSLFNISKIKFQKLLNKLKKFQDLMNKKNNYIDKIKKKALIRLIEKPFKFETIDKVVKVKKNLDVEYYLFREEYRIIFSYFYMHPCLLIDWIKVKLLNKSEFSKLVISLFKGISYNYKNECYFMIFMNKLFDYENSLKSEEKEINILEKFIHQNNKAYNSYLQYYIKLFKYYVLNDINLDKIYKSIFVKIKELIQENSKNQTNFKKPYAFCFYEIGELESYYNSEANAWKSSDFEERTDNLLRIFEIIYDELKNQICKANILKDTMKWIIFHFLKDKNIKNNINKNNIILQIIFYPLIKLLSYKSKKPLNDKNKIYNFNIESINQILISLITGNIIRKNEEVYPWISKINKNLFGKRNFRKEIFEQIISKENFIYRDNYFEEKIGIEIKNNLQLDERMIFLYFLDITKLNYEYITLDKYIFIKVIFSIKEIANTKEKSKYKFQNTFTDYYNSLAKNISLNGNNREFSYIDYEDYNDYINKNPSNNNKLRNFNIKLNVSYLLLKNYLKCKRCSKCRIVTLESIISLNNIEYIIPRFQESKKNNGLYYWFNFLENIKSNKELFNNFKNNPDYFNIEVLKNEWENSNNIIKRNSIIELINYINNILKRKIIKFNNKDFFVTNENNNVIILKQKHNNLNKKLQREAYRRYSYEQNIINISELCNWYLKNWIKNKIKKIKDYLLTDKIYDSNPNLGLYKKIELNLLIGFANWNLLQEFEKENRFVRRIIFKFNSKNIFKYIFKYLTRNEKLSIGSKYVNKIQNLYNNGLIVKYKIEKLENLSYDYDISFENDLDDKFFIVVSYDCSYKEIIAKFELSNRKIYKIIKDIYLLKEENIEIKNEKGEFIIFESEKFLEQYLKIFNSKNIYTILDYIIFKRKFIK